MDAWHNNPCFDFMVLNQFEFCAESPCVRPNAVVEFGTGQGSGQKISSLGEAEYASPCVMK